MPDLTEKDAAIVEAALQGHPDVAVGLGPLLRGECGIAARELVLRCLAKRLDRGVSLRGALMPALAEALRVARAVADLRGRNGRRFQ